MRALFGTLICHHIWLIVLNVYKRGLLNVSTELRRGTKLIKNSKHSKNDVILCVGSILLKCLPPARDTCYSLSKHGKYLVPRAQTNGYYNSFVSWGLRFCQYGFRCICFILCKFNFWLPINVYLTLSTKTHANARYDHEWLKSNFKPYPPPPSDKGYR